MDLYALAWKRLSREHALDEDGAAPFLYVEQDLPGRRLAHSCNFSSWRRDTSKAARTGLAYPVS